MDMSKFPEHAKLEAILDSDRDAIGGFLEWLESQGMMICHWVEGGTNGKPRRIPGTPEQIAEIEAREGKYSWEASTARKSGIENPDFDVWVSGWQADGVDAEKWLARYYDINRRALGEEKQRMYEMLVSSNRE